MSDLGNKEVMAKNLRSYMERCGKTQKELAEIVGVAPSTFNDWMKGKKYPRIDKIELLANYFGILKSDLIEDKSADHRLMEKKNDIISNIILKLIEDEELLNMVETLSELGFEEREAIKPVLNAFSKVGK